MKGLLISLPYAAILAGCISAPQEPTKYLPSTMEEVAQQVTVSRDDFKKLTNYRSSNVPATSGDSVFLRAFKYDSGVTTYQIYVADHYGGDWRFYNSAYDNNGNRLDFVSISRDVVYCGRYTGCTYSEHLAITVTRDYLQSAASKGILFKVSGKAGEEVFSIPDIYIQGFLASVAK